MRVKKRHQTPKDGDPAAAETFSPRASARHYDTLVEKLREQVAAKLARAAKFTRRSASEIRRDLADETADLSYFPCDDPRSSELWLCLTLDDLTDDEVEEAYRLAALIAHQAAQMLTVYERRLVKRHKRFVEAIAAVRVGAKGPDEVCAAGRALDHLAISWGPASEIFDDLLTLCETRLLHLQLLKDRVIRRFNELDFLKTVAPYSTDQGTLLQ